MKAAYRLTLTALIIFVWTLPALASEQAHEFIAGLEAYKTGDYQTAVDHFEAIADSGVVNGRLYYNLGNAYLKCNRLGPALLWYERALRLIPDDPDLQFNINYARSLTKDAVDDSGTPLVRIFFFWKYQLSHETIILLAIGFSFVFWGLLTARLITARRRLSRLALLAALPALVFALTAAFNFYEAAHIQRGIILPDQVPIRSGLEDQSTQLFLLHAGAKVTIVKKLKDHYQIRFTPDKIGWLAQGSVGMIK